MTGMATNPKETAMEFTPTPEQEAALALFQTGESFAIEAGAGTGKTATLVLLAKSTNRRGQYVAFNKAIVTEAGEKMPGTVACSTAHSLAFRAVGRQYAHRLKSGRMKSMEIAKRLNISGIKITYGTQTKQMSAGFLAGLAMRAVTNFDLSADEAPTERHIPYIDGIDVPTSDGRRTYHNNDEVRRHLMPAVRKAWADLSDPAGQLPYKHDHYLKTFELNDPVIAADFILFDEAQDASPVLLSIVRKQTHAQVVYVGDRNQSIYAFTGAVDALDAIRSEGKPVTFLTQSFRFGDAIATVANGLLERLNAELRLTGTPTILSVVGDVVDPDCILTRTNAEAVRTVFNMVSEGRKPALVGGGKEVIAFARGAIDLKEGTWTSHPDLACFSNWAEVIEYVDHDEQGDELRLLVKLVEEFGARQIISILESGVDERNADVTVSTAHKAKGREWATVKLAADFMPPKDGADDVSADELRLLYVSATRARRELDVSAVGHALAKPGDTPDTVGDIPEPSAARGTPEPALVPTTAPASAVPACPDCGRTDVVRGGLIGVHRCTGVVS